MKYLTELVCLLVIAIITLLLRKNPGENLYKYVAGKATVAYEKYAPYSFKMVREKAIELGQEFTETIFNPSYCTRWSGSISWIFLLL